jgi:hypothetical protein
LRNCQLHHFYIPCLHVTKPAANVGGMNVWSDYFAALSDRVLSVAQRVGELPWPELPALEKSEWLGSVPLVVWAGLALWLAMRSADGVQRLGGMRTTAYWWGGALLALAAAAWMPRLQVASLTWLFDVALGWMLFTLGQRIDTRWLLRNKALAMTALLEFALTLLVVSALLMQLGISSLTALIVGVIAAHSSPVILASFMPQWRADGQVSARAVHLGGISTLLAALCLPLLLALGESWQQASSSTTAASVAATAATTVPRPLFSQALPFIQRSGWELAQPLFLLLLAMLIGAALGRLLASPAQPLKNATKAWPGSETISLLAAVCVCAGLAQWWGAPAWAACLALGLGVRPKGRMVSRLHAPQSGLHEGIAALAQMVLFAFSAACLIDWLLRGAASFSDLQTALGMLIPLVALIALLRLCSKLFVCTLTAGWAGLRWQQGFALGLMLQPVSMTGLALLLMALPVLMVSDALLAMSLVIALILSDWIAPMALQRLLRRCGEIAEPQEEAADIPGLQSRNSVEPTRIDTAQQQAFDERVRLRLHDEALLHPVP